MEQPWFKDQQKTEYTQKNNWKILKLYHILTIKEIYIDQHMQAFDCTTYAIFQGMAEVIHATVLLQMHFPLQQNFTQN